MLELWARLDDAVRGERGLRLWLAWTKEKNLAGNRGCLCWRRVVAVPTKRGGETSTQGGMIDKGMQFLITYCSLVQNTAALKKL